MKRPYEITLTIRSDKPLLGDGMKLDPLLTQIEALVKDETGAKWMVCRVENYSAMVKV